MTSTPSTIAAGLSEAQIAVVKRTVRGIIAGDFFCSSRPEDIDVLNRMGMCNPRFEPSDYATRGYAHAGRATPLGLAVRAALTQDEAR